MGNAFVNTLYLHSISPFHTAFNQGLMNLFLLNQQSQNNTDAFPEYYEIFIAHYICHFNRRSQRCDKRREFRNTFFSCKYKLSRALWSKIGVQIFCKKFFDDFAFGIYPSPVFTIFTSLLFIVNSWSVRFCLNSWILPLFICI